MVSEREIEAATEAAFDTFYEGQGKWEALGKSPTAFRQNQWRRAMRAALEAAARVRAEDGEGGVNSLKRAVWLLSGTEMSFRRFWEIHGDNLDSLIKIAAPQPSGPVEALISAVGKYALEKGEGWRIDAGAEIMDAYQAALTAGKPRMKFAEALETARAGYEAWVRKPHSKKWVRRLDGTPIPNDLLVTIAQAFVKAPTPPTAGGSDE